MSYTVQFISPRGYWITCSGYFGDGGSGPDLRFRDEDYRPLRFADKDAAERYAADYHRQWRIVPDDREANTSFPCPRHPGDGAWLRASRELLLDVSQADLAVALGVSKSQVHNWERGIDRHTGKSCPVPRAVELAVEALVKRRLAGIVAAP